MQATHIHFKGGLYSLVGKAINSEDLSEWAVYYHISPHKKKMWIRPWDEFHGMHESGVKRFEAIID